jgi:ribonuclease HI
VILQAVKALPYVVLPSCVPIFYSITHIYTDSQTAINAINNPRGQSRQVIIREFLDGIDDIKNVEPQKQIAVTRIAGHSEIEGNEQADAEAKKAAMDPSPF